MKIPLFAALRCLREEFQIDSPSYPGLSTLFIFYTINVQVADLPDESFLLRI